MLERESATLVEHSARRRGDRTAFLSSATVATRSYTRRQDGQVGSRGSIPTAPRAKPPRIIIHGRPPRQGAATRAAALGVLGVNLLYGAVYQHETRRRSSPRSSMGSRASGSRWTCSSCAPRVAGVDDRLLSLQWSSRPSRRGDVTADGEIVQPRMSSRAAILVERGSFRPVTKADARPARQRARAVPPGAGAAREETVVLMEMTLAASPPTAHRPRGLPRARGDSHALDTTC